MLNSVEEGLGRWDQLHKLQETLEVGDVISDDWGPPGLGVVLDLHLVRERHVGVEWLDAGHHSGLQDHQ